jgi:hypothetical protein
VVVDLLSGREFLFPMLLDTGADVTCFSAKFATFFGHDNQHPKVIKEVCCGIGGKSITYVHSVQLSLLDPDKSTRAVRALAWTGTQKTAAFVEKLDVGFGLIGMDVISEWESVKLENKGKRLTIKIEL